MTEESKEYKQSDTTAVWEYTEFKALQAHVTEINKLHLRDLLSSKANKDCLQRNERLTIKHGALTLDCTRQKATLETISLLSKLAKAANINAKINAMFVGDKINRTENRSVLHIALRSKPSDKIIVDGINVVSAVHKVLNKIQTFSNRVRAGQWKGYSGKEIRNVISIGIGGSYLGAEFVYQSLKTDPTASANAKGRQLRFYANIDPIGFARATSVYLY